MKDIVFAIFAACFGVLVLLACLVGVLYIVFELYAYIVEKVSKLKDRGML